MKKEFIPPDFLQIPFVVVCDKTLQPLDKTIYGFIYWLEKLKDGKCFASNNYIATALGSTSKSVANSLTRLEKAGYIIRPLNEDGLRSEIKCCVSYQKVKPKVSLASEGVSSNSEGVSLNDDRVSSNSEHNKKIKEENKEENKIHDWQAIVLYFYDKIAPETSPRLRFKKQTKDAALHLLSLHPLDRITLKIDVLAGMPREKKYVTSFEVFANKYSTLPGEIISPSHFTKPAFVPTDDEALNSFLR